MIKQWAKLAADATFQQLAKIQLQSGFVLVYKLNDYTSA